MKLNTILRTLNNCRQSRNISILSTLQKSPVLVSANKDIFTNLALEHWLYTNLRFKSENNQKDLPEDKSKVFLKPVVLIWTDEPCVVVGRHQNPWVESNLGIVNKAGVKLARRHSGGGCVYHDENNVNISIIGDRSTFGNRQDNLKFLAGVLDEKYKIKCEPNKRHDLVHSETGFKISGSAAKLGRYNSYHHFTVLVDTDKEALYTVLRQNQQDFVETYSSKSTHSKVLNLKEMRKDLEVNQVITDLANAYNKLYGCRTSLEDSMKQEHPEVDHSEYENMSKFKEELESWNWIYGKTPAFKMEKSLPVVDSGVQKQVNFVVQVNRGCFESINIDSSLAGSNPSDKFKYLIGTKFTYKDAMVNVAKLFDIDGRQISSEGNAIGTQTIFATLLLQMIHEANF